MSDTYDPYLDIAVEIRVSVQHELKTWTFSHFVKFLYTSLLIVVTCCPNCELCLVQQAANIVRALELFVKPDVLSGENAYMCAKYVEIFHHLFHTNFIYSTFNCCIDFVLGELFSVVTPKHWGYKQGVLSDFVQVQEESSSNKALHCPPDIQCSDAVAQEVCQLQWRQDH